MKKHHCITKFVLKHDQYDNSPITVHSTSQQIALPEYRQVNRFKYVMDVNNPFEVSSQFKEANGIQRQVQNDILLLSKQERDPPKKSTPKRYTKMMTDKTPQNSPAVPKEPQKEKYLPPKTDKKPTLVLDLDSTILYSKTQKILREELPDTPPEHCFGDYLVTCYRSYLYTFMKYIHENFEVVVWSAAEYNYVKHRLLYNDLVQFIDSALSRDHCSQISGNYVKDLNNLGRDLNNVVLLDDNFCSCVMNVQNCIPVQRFLGQRDDELLQLIVLLRKILQYDTIVKGIECQIGCLQGYFNTLQNKSQKIE